MKCSARGCLEDAVWALKWRNPSIHPDARVKIWCACDTHRTTLAEFLTMRSFPLEIVPVEAPDSDA